MKASFFGAALAALAAAAVALPTDDKASAFEVLKTVAEVDLSVPESPGVALLGLSPNSVQRPGTTREVVTAFVKGFDSNGKPRTGFAVDVAPLPTFAPQLIVGGQRYKDSWPVQVLTRSTVSLAVADAGNGASQFAWGLRVGIVDQSDPGLYATEFADCIRKSSVFGGAPPPGPSVGDASAAAAEATSAKVKACQPATRLALWGKPAWYVGLGQSWFSASGTLRDREPAAAALWTTLSAGREVAGMRTLLLLHAERRNDDRVPDPSDSTRLLREDRGSAVARLRMGTEKWHAHVEAGQARVRRDAETTRRVNQFGAGAELRLHDQLWLQLARTREKGYDNGAIDRVTMGVRFGEQPFLAAP